MTKSRNVLITQSGCSVFNRNVWRLEVLLLLLKFLRTVIKQKDFIRNVFLFFFFPNPSPPRKDWGELRPPVHYSRLQHVFGIVCVKATKKQLCMDINANVTQWKKKSCSVGLTCRTLRAGPCSCTWSFVTEEEEEEEEEGEEQCKRNWTFGRTSLNSWPKECRLPRANVQKEELNHRKLKIKTTKRWVNQLICLNIHALHLIIMDEQNQACQLIQIIYDQY